VRPISIAVCCASVGGRCPPEPVVAAGADGVPGSRARATPPEPMPLAVGSGAGVASS
jgi:hypothetical protein